MSTKIIDKAETSNDIYTVLSTAVMFRAWNRIVKRFQHFSLQDIEKQKGNIRWELLDITENTMIKDTKGKYIFIGDIIYWKWNGCEAEYMLVTDKYVFKNRTINSLAKSQIHLELPSICEVIGNIYETPDLRYSCR